MKRMLIISVFLISIIFIACGNEKTDEGIVLAKVGDEVLTQTELFYTIPDQYESQMSAEDYGKAVETWINTEVLYQNAIKIGLDKDPEVKALIKFGTKETIANKFIEEQLVQSIYISPEDVDTIYSRQKEKYKLEQDRLRASHILLPTKEEADAVYNRLKGGGDFAVLAADYSLDRQSSANGGDIGYFTEEVMEPEFYKAAVKLKVGSFSKPVKTTYGFHIIKLTEKQFAGEAIDSLEVKQHIYDQLYSDQHTAAFQMMLDSLRSNANIEKFEMNPLGTQTIPGME
jgi:parvulin-like peptidyl-prolyl isomerase